MSCAANCRRVFSAGCTSLPPAKNERKGDPMTGATWSDMKFLTIYELAVMMRISKMSAYRLVRTGELEAIRVGRAYRIPEQAVISYMRDAAFTPTGLAS